MFILDFLSGNVILELKMVYSPFSKEDMLSFHIILPFLIHEKY